MKNNSRRASFSGNLRSATGPVPRRAANPQAMLYRERSFSALLANEDVGFVAVGQTVKLKLAASPFQKYGMLEGKVTQISADAIEQSEAARAAGTNPMAGAVQTYKAIVELSEQGLRLPTGKHLDIAPGMAAMVEIHQGRRSVIEYLLSPV